MIDTRARPAGQQRLRFRRVRVREHAGDWVSFCTMLRAELGADHRASIDRLTRGLERSDAERRSEQEKQPRSAGQDSIRKSRRITQRRNLGHSAIRRPVESASPARTTTGSDAVQGAAAPNLCAANRATMQSSTSRVRPVSSLGMTHVGFPAASIDAWIVNLPSSIVGVDCLSLSRSSARGRARAARRWSRCPAVVPAKDLKPGMLR